MTSSALLCSMPAVGHVGPLLVVARELQRRGWQVRMLTGARYRRMVEDAGIRFLALPAEADTLDGIGAGDDERDRGLATINRGVERAFVDPAAPDFSGLDVAISGVPFDLAASNRAGTRFGPRAVRTIERVGPYHHVLRVAPLHEMAVADVGDVPFSSRYGVASAWATSSGG